MPARDTGLLFGRRCSCPSMTGETIRKAVEYIEWNPVSRNLVANPCAWAWSSARARSGRRDVPLRIDTIDVALNGRQGDQGEP